MLRAMVRMASAAAVVVADPTFYPTEEKVGEDSLQTFIAAQFRCAVDHHLVTLGKPAFVGSDQFLYWERFRPQKVVAPDVYVLPGVPRGARIRCLKTWEDGVVPSFALEIISENDVEGDYRESPGRYDELGVTELVVFDPDHHRASDRVRFQVLRRARGRGLTRVTETNDDRVRSRVLGCWIRAVGKGDKVRLRLAVGARGDTILPTELEAERARADAEAARADAESARADAESARAEAAEAKLARLAAGSKRGKKTATKA
jgi:hypothetical protein